MQVASGAVDCPGLGMVALAAGAGALAPDLDHRGSKASMAIPLAMLSGAFLLWMASRVAADVPAIFMGFSAEMPPEVLAFLTPVLFWNGLFLLVAGVALPFIGHRGPVHSIGAGVIFTVLFVVSLALLGAPLWLAAIFALGWASHLLLDLPSRTGLPHLLWPLRSAEDDPLP